MSTIVCVFSRASAVIITVAYIVCAPYLIHWVESVRLMKLVTSRANSCHVTRRLSNHNSHRPHMPIHAGALGRIFIAWIDSRISRIHAQL